MDAQRTVTSEPTPAPSNRSETFSFQSYLVWFAVLVLVIYPLSAGPALRLAHSGHLPVASTMAFYRPLVEICDRYKPLGQAFTWYTGTYLSRVF